MNLLWQSVRSDSPEASARDGFRVAVAELALLALGEVAEVPIVSIVVALPVALHVRLALVIQQARATERSLAIAPVPPPVLDHRLDDLVLVDAPVQLPAAAPLEAVELVPVWLRLDPVQVLLRAVLVSLDVVALPADARESLHLAVRLARLRVTHPLLLAALGLAVALQLTVRALGLSAGAHVSVPFLSLVPPFLFRGRSRATVPLQHAPPHRHVRFELSVEPLPL